MAHRCAADLGVRTSGRDMRYTVGKRLEQFKQLSDQRKGKTTNPKTKKAHIPTELLFNVLADTNRSDMFEILPHALRTYNKGAPKTV